MKTAKLTALVVLLIATSSCMFDGFGIKGNKNVVSEDRKVTSEFSGLKVSQGIHVFLSQGNETSISIEADENIIDLLVTEVQGDVLKIYFDKNVSKAKAKNVYLTTDNISSIKVSSGSSVSSESTIKSENLKLSSSSGASLKLSVNASGIICSASSGAHINLNGSTDSFDGDASSGSHIKATNLSARIAKANVSSGAGISLHASEELDARASSGGNISYEGNPTILDRNKSSGGSISKR